MIPVFIMSIRRHGPMISIQALQSLSGDDLTSRAGSGRSRYNRLHVIA